MWSVRRKGGYMPKKSQFQNLTLQQTLQDCAQQPTTIQPAITLPIKPEALIPLPPAMPFFVQSLPAKQGTTAVISKESDLAVSAPDTAEEISTPLLPGALIPATNP